ncbi:MAG: AAA family ATPase [Desulfobulbus sp.]
MLDNIPVAPTPGPVLNPAPHGLALVRDPSLAMALVGELRPVLSIDLVDDSLQELARTLQNRTPSLLFLHPTSETADQDLEFADYVRRAHPDIDIYLILDRRDPEIILRALRLGIRDCILPGEGEPTPFLQAIRRTRSAPDTGGGFLYACHSLKGGQGVTTIAANLADQIRRVTGGQVLLADLNLCMGDLRSLLSITGACTPFDLIRDLGRMDENLLFSSLFHHENGFYVLPSPAEIGDAEVVSREQITALLALLKRHFTHIVIDLPHDLSERTLAALENADRILLPIEPGLIALKNAQKHVQFFRELGNDEEKIALILNRHSKRDTLQPEDMERVLGLPLFATIANDWTAFEQAADRGTLLADVHPKRRVTRDLHELALRLTGMNEAGAHPGFRSWFSGLFAGR